MTAVSGADYSINFLVSDHVRFTVVNSNLSFCDSTLITHILWETISSRFKQTSYDAGSYGVEGGGSTTAYAVRAVKLRPTLGMILQQQTMATPLPTETCPGFYLPLQHQHLACKTLLLLLWMIEQCSASCSTKHTTTWHGGTLFRPCGRQAFMVALRYPAYYRGIFCRSTRCRLEGLLSPDAGRKSGSTWSLSKSLCAGRRCVLDAVVSWAPLCAGRRHVLNVVTAAAATACEGVTGLARRL